MRDMELQKELDALKDAPFAKMKDTQLLAIENIYRTDEELISIAKKYMNKIDFKKNDNSAYKTTWSRGKAFFNNACSHMNKNKNKAWTKKELVDIAKKYKSRKEFRKNAAGAYMSAHNKGKEFLDEICKHMKGTVYKKYTIDIVKNIAKKYSKRSIFAKNEPNAYAYAVRHKLLNNVCSHMK